MKFKEPLSGKLEYVINVKSFIWVISNYLTRMQIFKGSNSGQVEIVKIDASTSEIKNHDIYNYGPIP